MNQRVRIVLPFSCYSKKFRTFKLQAVNTVILFCIFFFCNFILFFSLLAYFTIKKMQDFYYCADFYGSLFLSILIYFVFVRISQPHILLLFQKVSIGTILTMSILFQYRFFFSFISNFVNHKGTHSDRS